MQIIFFRIKKEKGCRKVMSLFLSKKVENSCRGRQNVIKLTSYMLEVILQPPYSHYMDPVSYDFTTNFEKLSLLVALLMHLQTIRGMTRHLIHGIVGCLATSFASIRKMET